MELLRLIMSWFVALIVGGAAGAMFWTDYQSQKQHDKWMRDFTRRTNEKFGEGWEEELDAWLRTRR